jgi:SAM-dependent methyltransferase
MAEISKAEYLEALERAGLTGHPGGIAGTETLIRRLDIRQGERVLDLGCGTGYTSCLIARQQGAKVVAADLRPGMLTWAGKRVRRGHISDAVCLVAADAHHLPFKDGSFDAAVVESVLVFCDVPVTLAELYRVLKPGGRMGCNEVTTLQRMSPKEREQFRGSFGVVPLTTTADEWTGAFKSAGFVDIIADVKPIDWLNLSLFTPLRTDGLWRYLAAIVKSLTDPKIRKISRLKTAFIRSGLMRDLGSGLYMARKP